MRFVNESWGFEFSGLIVEVDSCSVLFSDVFKSLTMVVKVS